VYKKNYPPPPKKKLKFKKNKNTKKIHFKLCKKSEKNITTNIIFLIRKIRITYFYHLHSYFENITSQFYFVISMFNVILRNPQKNPKKLKLKKIGGGQKVGRWDFDKHETLEGLNFMRKPGSGKPVCSGSVHYKKDI